MVLFLLNHGAKISMIGERLDNTPLALARKKGNKAIVKILREWKQKKRKTKRKKK
jgi:hypothetical protein